MDFSLLRRPSGFLPIAISLVLLAMMAGLAVTGRLVPEPDEGAPAHIFQILMAAQALIILFFAIMWLPRAPRSAVLVLSLQIAAALAAMAPVYFLKL